jgi:hypothetical protein
MLIQGRLAWRYAPIAQRALDYDRMHSVDNAPNALFEPCYEYRFSNASRIIFIVNLPAAILIGTPDGCPQSLLGRALQEVRYRPPIKTGIISSRRFHSLRGLHPVVVGWSLAGSPTHAIEVHAMVHHTRCDYYLRRHRDDPNHVLPAWKRCGTRQRYFGNGYSSRLDSPDCYVPDIRCDVGNKNNQRSKVSTCRPLLIDHGKNPA